MTDENTKLEDTMKEVGMSERDDLRIKRKTERDRWNNGLVVFCYKLVETVIGRKRNA